MNAEDSEMASQAGEWVVRMHAHDCTEEERAACLRWRARSPAHEATFRGMERAWLRSAGLAANPAIAAALREAERDGMQARRSRRRRWAVPLAMAASLGLVAVLVGPMRLLDDRPTEVQQYGTAVGEQREVVLPDGTAVLLDTDTTLAVRYSKRTRRVELTAGQARFAVTPDAERPFTVSANGGQVTAVGTAFTVRLDAAATTVTLLEGAVVVEGPADAAERRPPARLKPGEQLRFARDGGEWATTIVNLDVAGAWTEGHVFADDWPLSRLVDEVNRYSAVKLRADPAVAELRISGGFRFDDPQALALLLSHSLPVQSAEAGNEIVLRRR
ncbi:FecR family protein [Pseudoxanthomonas suwonensis]|uniref:Anti-FecI sigma factor, FecR n=1 Tax=Pseudoxanthomonas suwonensis TaxID=314722 RepID=A0A0E3Z054_9GAMM|nr:FecR domain-containing protein [Pseudoxanthomonas suwonensis]AKC86323.1 hypothetical protein WQ53_05570 [Pseudoxanthomonas suwonensis]